MYDIVIMENHSLISMFGCDLSPFLTCLFINLEIPSFEFLKFWPSHTLYLKIKSSSSQVYVFIEGIHLCFQPRKLDVTLDTKFSSINRHLLSIYCESGTMQSAGDMVPDLKGLNIQIVTELYCYLICMKACIKQ